MRRVHYLLIPALFLLLQCAALQQLMQRPTCTYQSMEVEKLSLAEGTFNFNFKLENPNPIGFHINKVDYDIELNDEPFFSGVMEKGFNLPAAAGSEFELPVTIEYLKFFKTVQDFMKLDEIPYTLSGSVTVGSFRIPFRTSGIFKRPDLPKVSLQSVNVSGLSLLGADLMISMILQNSNQFPLMLDGLDYNVKLANVSILSGKSADILQIAENGERVIQLPVKVGFLELGQSLAQLLKGSTVNYSIEGNLQSKTGKGSLQPFPFKKYGVVSIRR